MSRLAINTIEAVRCCNHKMIKFVMRSDSNMFFISIENPFTGEVSMEGSRFITRKKRTVKTMFLELIMLARLLKNMMEALSSLFMTILLWLAFSFYRENQFLR